MSIDDTRTSTWVTLGEGKPRAMQVRRCRLEVVGGPEAGRTADVETSLIRVGARHGNDLVIADRRMSGHHFEIVLDGRGYRLRDLGSTNGTFVGGHEVRDIYLNPGTVIYAGDHRIRFEPQSSAVEVELSDLEQLGGMVGSSIAMRALFARLQRIAPTDATVLITGETGTGKELVAEALHDGSPRRDQPFVVVDCGSLPTNLIESVLFGHERGAFTGAERAHAGVFEEASGGTVFLDELGELPLDLQPKLLGVLERRIVRRIGGTRPIPVDVRLVAATNRDPVKEMNQGRFREDLYYRLAVVRVHVPALRDRRDDIPLLIDHFLSMLPDAANVQLTPEVSDQLANHDYPGNVRELRNLVERAVVMARIGSGGGMNLAAIEPAAPAVVADRAGGLGIPIDVELPYKVLKQQVIEELDRRYFQELLKKYDGNVSKVARAAGLDRMTVHKLLSRRGVVVIRRSSGG